MGLAGQFRRTPHLPATVTEDAQDLQLVDGIDGGGQESLNVFRYRLHNLHPPAPRSKNARGAPAGKAGSALHWPRKHTGGVLPSRGRRPGGDGGSGHPPRAAGFLSEPGNADGHRVKLPSLGTSPSPPSGGRRRPPFRGPRRRGLRRGRRGTTRDPRVRDTGTAPKAAPRGPTPMETPPKGVAAAGRPRRVVIRPVAGVHRHGVKHSWRRRSSRRARPLVPLVPAATSHGHRAPVDPHLAGVAWRTGSPPPAGLSSRCGGTSR